MRRLRLPRSFHQQIVAVTAGVTAVAMLLLTLVLQLVLARIATNDLDRVLADRAEAVISSASAGPSGSVVVPASPLDPAWPRTTPRGAWSPGTSRTASRTRSGRSAGPGPPRCGTWATCPRPGSAVLQGGRGRRRRGRRRASQAVRGGRAPRPDRQPGDRRARDAGRGGDRGVDDTSSTAAGRRDGGDRGGVERARAVPSLRPRPARQRDQRLGRHARPAAGQGVLSDPVGAAADRRSWPTSCAPP